jgi:hypothetical protein
LEQAPWQSDKALVSALRDKGARIQPTSEGGGETVYDQYSVVIDRMPPGVTPQGFLRKMSVDLNKAVDNRTFDRINEFRRRATGGTPAVGDIYDIDIPGDDGSVVLAQESASSFIFQTIVTPVNETGSHPEYGVREFGFRELPDGGTQFFTRGVSRPQNSLFGVIGGVVQRVSWRSLVEGIGATLVRDGGRLRPGSMRELTTAN